MASEAITASKQPQRSNLTSELRSVTSITYTYHVFLASIYHYFKNFPRPIIIPGLAELRSQVKMDSSCRSGKEYE